MPEDWSKLLDVDPLAEARACFDVELPLTELPRVRPLLAEPAGLARGRVCFDRVRGLAVADVQVAATPRLRCERCLGPMQWPVSASGRVALVADAAEADRAPAELETVLAPEHRLAVRDLLEEELLLALPLVPRHADACAAQGAAPSDAQAGDEKRQRPFADLQQLLQRRER